MSFRTVEWMQERLHTLHDEIDCLKYEAEKAAETERAKIVALLHEHLNDWCKEETESGDIKHQYHQGSDALERLLWAIEHKEHLK